MAVPNHPMSALKGTAEGKALMAKVSAHRGGGTPSTGKAASSRDQATRHADTASGAAMGDGSYPIKDATQLADAVKDWVRTGRSLTVKSHILSRAKALGLPAPSGLSPAKQTDELDIGKTIAARGK